MNTQVLNKTRIISKHLFVSSVGLNINKLIILFYYLRFLAFLFQLFISRNSSIIDKKIHAVILQTLSLMHSDNLHK